MLKPNELQAMLTDLESDRIERMVSTSHTGTFSQPVFTLSNKPEEGAPSKGGLT